MTALPESLRLTAEDIEQLIGEYKHLHQHPELSHQETETTVYLKGRLEGLALAEGVERTVTRIGVSGLVMVLRNGEGPVAGFRADIDGLPVREESGVAWASEAVGMLDGAEVPVMHACGHDSHMAAALMAAQKLAAASDVWKGTLVFVFQPAEEVGNGASTMVEAGLWDHAPKPDVLFSQHVFPFLRGKINLSIREVMAAADSFRITVKGRGSHGSQPENSIDPIVLGASMIVRLQTVVSREISPLDPAVVTVGTFKGGLKENVIPDSAEFTINTRTFTPEVRRKVLGAIERIIRGEAAAAGAPEPVIERTTSFPPTFNNEERTAGLLEAFRGEFGEDGVAYDPTQLVMGSEDFTDLVKDMGVPTVFWFFGGYTQEQLDQKEVPTNHSPFFAPTPEVTLETATRAAIAAVLSALG